jgi:hypothetical protein
MVRGRERVMDEVNRNTLSTSCCQNCRSSRHRCIPTLSFLISQLSTLNSWFIYNQAGAWETGTLSGYDVVRPRPLGAFVGDIASASWFTPAICDVSKPSSVIADFCVKPLVKLPFVTSGMRMITSVLLMRRLMLHVYVELALSPADGGDVCKWSLQVNYNPITNPSR